MDADVDRQGDGLCFDTDRLWSGLFVLCDRSDGIPEEFK